jgi:hypothetical protein
VEVLETSETKLVDSDADTEEMPLPVLIREVVLVKAGMKLVTSEKKIYNCYNE